jgi:hypothetical protein
MTIPDEKSTGKKKRKRKNPNRAKQRSGHLEGIEEGRGTSGCYLSKVWERNHAQRKNGIWV